MIRAPMLARLITGSAKVAFAILAFCVYAPGPVAARPLDDVVASGSLRVIVYLDNAPFSWETEDGEKKGIEVDLGHALARELGVKAEIVLRMPGEKADDDVRANVWRGPLTGGGVGDVMLHVPIDREFAARNSEAVLGNSYFQERVVLAIHPELTGEVTSFDVFKTKKIGVQLGTVADYFLMTYQDGVLIETISHHVKPEVGAKEFLSKETTALLGVRSKIEAMLFERNVKPVFVAPPMDGIVRTQWVLGTGVKQDSRDLGYALQAALKKLADSGEMTKLFAKYGVTYFAPPVD